MTSLDKVDKELAKVNVKRDELRLEAQELTRQRDQLAAEESARAKVASLSDVERKALLQVLEPAGIESAEEVS
jgi:hypothetical protein